MAKELKVTAIAKKLAQVRADIAEVKEITLAPLEQAEEELRQQLLQELKATGLQTIRVDGHNYIRQHKTSFSIEDEAKAMAWASRYPQLVKPATVNVVKATPVLLHELTLPEGFSRTDTEFISVRKAEQSDE